MFTLRFVNVPDAGTRHYETREQAIAAGRSFGFEFVVEQGGSIIASWSVFGGLRGAR